MKTKNQISRLDPSDNLSLNSDCPSGVPFEFVEWPGQGREINYKSSEIQARPFDVTWTSRSPRAHPILSESPHTVYQTVAKKCRGSSRSRKDPNKKSFDSECSLSFDLNP